MWKKAIPGNWNWLTKKVGGNHSGTWIHPDLAVQLAQWISPAFAIQVNRWVRELMTMGSVSIESKKTDEELKQLQEKILRLENENRETCERLNRSLGANLVLQNYVDNVKQRLKKETEKRDPIHSHHESLCQ